MAHWHIAHVAKWVLVNINVSSYVTRTLITVTQKALLKNDDSSLRRVLF